MILFTVIFVVMQVSADPPAALVAMGAARAAIRSGRIDYIRESNLGTPNERQRYVAALFAANGDLIEQDFGDQEGVIRRDQRGHPTLALPLYKLYKDGGLWERPELDTLIEWYAKPDPVLIPWDPRTAGMQRRFADAESQAVLDGIRLKKETPWRFSSRTEKAGDVHVVTIELDALGGVNRRMVWWIDEQKGWNPQRVALLVGEETAMEARAELKKTDGVWFPESVEYYRGGNLVERYRTLSIQVNQPDDPVTFSPEDIGVESGMHLTGTYKDIDMNAVPTWSSKVHAPVPNKQFREFLKDGTDTVSPNVRLIQSLVISGQHPTQQLIHASVSNQKYLNESHIGGWERYVLGFIETYKLDDEQRQRAMTILRDCQDKGRQYVARNRSLLDELHGKLMQSKPEGAAAEQAEVQKILADIDRIFSEELKPRLETLPTRAQREAVEAKQAANKKDDKGDKGEKDGKKAP